jgi:hypothetical protein
VAVVNAFADLEKLEIIVDCLLVFLDVIVEDADGVIGPPFVPHLSSPPAPEGQHLVVLKSAHDCNVGGVVDLLLELLRVLLGSFVEDGVFLGDSGGSIEEKGQLYSMRLRGGHGPIVALLVETAHLVLLGERPPDSEGFVGVALVAAVPTPGSAIHNKNINRDTPINLFRSTHLKNI